MHTARKQNLKLLIFGGNGLLGKQLQKDASEKGFPFVATYRNNNSKGRVVCDILNEQDLQRVFESAQPNAVINAANNTGGVNFCETNPEFTRSFHVDANIRIGKLCNQHNARMVLISTDYVFDGTHPPYKEDDATHPLNKYGSFKLEAEKWMQQNIKKFIIVRTTNVFGWDPLSPTPNYLMNLYLKLSKGEKAEASSFLWGSPTHVAQLSRTILELCEKELNGIFHVVGSSFISRYEWAKQFCEMLGFDKNLLVELKEPPQNTAPRPSRPELSTEKIGSICTTPVEDVTTGLKRFLEEMQHNAVLTT